MTEAKKTTHHRTIIILLIIALCAIVYGVQVSFNDALNKYAHLKHPSVHVDGMVLKTPKALSSFHFTDNQGQAFTQAQLKGKWSLLFFGYTNCGYVCPTTLAALKKMYQDLEQQLPKKQLPQVVLISVDPKRDTQTRLDQYVKAFNPEFIGLRGDEAQTAKIEKELGIAATKIYAADGDQSHYTISHSAEIIVVDPHAKVQAYLSFPHSSDEMIKDYTKLVQAYQNQKDIG